MKKDIFPRPPGASDDIPVDVIDPPEVEQKKKGLVRRSFGGLWSGVCRAGEMAFSGVVAATNAVGRAFGWAGGGVAWAYDKTLRPMLNWVEWWVPGFSHLRTTLCYYALGMTLMGVLIGILLAANAGFGLLISIGFGLLMGLIIIPLVLVTPALWLGVAFDLWMISAFFCTVDAIAEKVIDKTPFWDNLSSKMAPGIYIWATRKRAESAVGAPLPAKC